jgi:hypothetical protein
VVWPSPRLAARCPRLAPPTADAAAGVDRGSVEPRPAWCAPVVLACRCTSPFSVNPAGSSIWPTLPPHRRRGWTHQRPGPSRRDEPLLRRGDLPTRPQHLLPLLLPLHRQQHNMPAARGERLPRDAFDAWSAPHGALFAGSPQEIIDKMLWEHEVLGHDRFPRAASGAFRTRRPPAPSSSSRPRFSR